jgi:hypothetical protein
MREYAIGFLAGFTSSMWVSLNWEYIKDLFKNLFKNK